MKQWLKFIINISFLLTPYSYQLPFSSSIKPFNQHLYRKNYYFNIILKLGENAMEIIGRILCYLIQVSLSCFILLSSQKQEVLCALCCLCRIGPLASTISSDCANLAGAVGQECPFTIPPCCCL